MKSTTGWREPVHARLRTWRDLLNSDVDASFREKHAQSLDVDAFPLSSYPDAALFGHGVGSVSDGNCYHGAVRSPALRDVRGSLPDDVLHPRHVGAKRRISVRRDRM